MSKDRRVLQLHGGIIAVGLTDRQSQIFLARKAFAEKYCHDHGWNLDKLSIEQLLEIRAQPGWQNPT